MPITEEQYNRLAEQSYWTEEKAIQMEELATYFENLSTSIQKQIEEIVATNQKLAGEFKK